MELTAENKLKKLIIVGDRVLIKPLKESDKTTSGILLPPGVREKEKIQTGFIVKVGPGYPIPLPMDEDDAWKQEEDQKPRRRNSTNQSNAGPQESPSQRHTAGS